jgi:4-hydroxybenzoate polyprenyltransferase
MGTIYSVPPIRFRNTAFSTTFIGIGSSIAYFIGYFTPRYVQVGTMPPFEFVKILPSSLSAEGIEIGILIAILLSIGPLVTDFKDYESEKRVGVRSIYTIYGKEKGVSIVSILLFLSFASMLILFHKPIDFAVYIPFGLLASFLFKRYNIVRGIFALYFPILVYSIMRWLQIIC